jgi:hypothetical protein
MCQCEVGGFNCEIMNHCWMVYVWFRLAACTLAPNHRLHSSRCLISIHLVFGWFHSWQSSPGCSDFWSVGLGAGRLGVFFVAAFCPQFSLALGFPAEESCSFVALPALVPSEAFRPARSGIFLCLRFLPPTDFRIFRSQVFPT